MMNAPAEDAPGLPKPRRRLMARLFAPTVVALALASALAAFLILMGLTRIVPSPQVAVGVLAGCGVAGLILLAIIAREVWGIFRERARGRAASRLHVRIVGLFAGRGGGAGTVVVAHGGEPHPRP